MNKKKVAGRGQVISGYLLYRSPWTTGKQVARDLRAIADMIESDQDTEWFIMPVNSRGHWCESDDEDFSNYIIGPS